ncbi:protein of unknown function [Clostridium beijerinckii]|nr:protein of unknown function [Clostridium beijerinckii]
MTFFNKLNNILLLSYYFYLYQALGIAVCSSTAATANGI